MGGFATGDGDPRTTTAGQSEMVLRDRQWSFAIGQCKRGTVREREGEGEVADGVDLEKKDPSGIENRYFDLLLVPISVCAFSTILELKTPKSNFAGLSRGVGLILQGTWFVQMGFSFYSDLMAHGCSLHEKSRGNYTVRCKGHPEYHRGRAIATLQFNCHLSFLVVLIVGVFSLINKKNGGRGEFMRYKPLGAEMQQLDNQARFTLDSDDDKDDGIKEEGNVADLRAVVMVPELGINGDGSHQ
ncbi:hypothetical protein F0562_004989 [Nyssa sinensis]|uniref:Uncharacterized protein n=1 Tax=Nyssa sinensis TaxID=561372 RepID=A0A5J5AI71_9ASTE|nr:hypothetical protein F0562_004989 [Nyssa sinensis]